MDYKKLIAELLEKIDDEETLKFLIAFLKRRQK